MTIRAALILTAFLALPCIADTVGGLRRAPSLGVALKPSDGGVTIDAVSPGSAAANMGLERGDTVVSVDGATIANSAAFVAAVARKRAGDAVTIVVTRGDATITKEGKLGAVPLEKQAAYDIEYGSVDSGTGRRRVIVTRPRDTAKHPAVLLIGGIGCYSLDGLLRPAELREPYAKILDALTRAGYVTMRVEKSGMGDSEGPPCSDPRSDLDSEVRGNAAGLTQLESLEFVDRGNVFIFAHSIGPLVAAQIAAKHPVRGLVLAETIGTGWLEYDLTNVRRQLLLSGASYDEVDRRVRHHEICAHRFFIEKQMADKSCAADLEAPAPYTYMQQLGSLDLAPLWKQIDAPVRIFYGTADFVTDDYQHQYLTNMINAFHAGRATYVRIEGMDHGLTLPGSQKASFEGTSPAPFAQRVVEETLRFLDKARSTPQ